MDQSEIVVVRALGEHPLRDGSDGIARRVDLGSSFTKTLRDGTTKRFQYLNRQKKEESLSIVGSREFDMKNLIDKHNLNTLRVQMEAYPELELDRQLQIIDPEADANKALKLEVDRQELKSTLLAKIQDQEWMARLYRHVVGPASGLNAKAMWRVLNEKANTELAPFKLKNGKWFWADDDYELQALLDLAIEKQLLSVDRESGAVKQVDGKVFAKDRELAINLLKTDHEYRKSVERQVIAGLEVQYGLPDKSTESSEFIKLVEEVGTDDTGAAFNDDNSLDEQTEEDKRNAELSELVAKMIKAELAVVDEESGEIALPESGGKVFANTQEVIGFLKGNEEQVRLYDGLVNS